MSNEQMLSLYAQLNEYILRHFEFFWAIVIGVFAIIGVALYSIAKASIAKGIEKEAEKEGKRYSGLEARIDQMRAASLRYHPTEYTLQLEEGIKSAGKCCYSKNSDDLVVV